MSDVSVWARCCWGCPASGCLEVDDTDVEVVSVESMAVRAVDIRDLACFGRPARRRAAERYLEATTTFRPSTIKHRGGSLELFAMSLAEHRSASQLERVHHRRIPRLEPWQALAWSTRRRPTRVDRPPTPRRLQAEDVLSRTPPVTMRSVALAPRRDPPCAHDIIVKPTTGA